MSILMYSAPGTDCHKANRIWFFAPPIATALLVSGTLIFGGYPQGHDWLYDLVRIIEYREALLSGQVIPYWAENLYHGFGSPVFIFYAPLFSAGSALLMTTGMSVTAAATSMIVTFMIAASIGMAGLTRELVGRQDPNAGAASRVASAAFILAPYFLADCLIRNAGAEFAALALAPYPFWGLALYFRSHSRGLILLIIGFALVVLSHNLTALVVVAFLLAGSFTFLVKRELQKFWAVMISIALSLGFSAWFWLPALSLTEYMRMDDLLTGKLDFHNNFNSIFETFSYGGLFAIGWLHPIVLMLGMVMVWKKRSRLAMALIFIGFLLIFLQTDASIPIWETLPFLPLFQFPWRFLGPLALVTALLLGLLFREYLGKVPHAELLMIILLAVNAIPVLHSYFQFPKVTETVAITPEIVRTRGLSVTVLDEYLPKGASIATVEQDPSRRIVLGASSEIETFEARQRSGNRFQIEVIAAGNGRIHLAKWFFPGWKAELNDEALVVRPSPRGELQLDIPSGSHRITVWLAQPQARVVGFLISGFSSVIFATFVIRLRSFRAFDKMASG